MNLKLNQLVASALVIILLFIAKVRADVPHYRAEKGIALAVSELADLDRLGAGWFYQWSESCGDPRCVPMVRSMQMPQTCLAYLLVGNEPNAREPYGAPVTPKDAAARVIAIEAQCPQTKLVIGNVSADDWSAADGWGSGYNWLRTFLREYRALTGHAYRGILGVHCFTQHAASYCVSQFSAMRGLYSGEMWITEMGVLSGDATQCRKLYNYAFSGRFKRVAIFTNRQPHTGQGWEISMGVELVNDDGSLTSCGKIFANL